MLQLELATTLHADRRTRFEAAARSHRALLGAPCPPSGSGRLQGVLAALRRATRQPAPCVELASRPA